MEQINIPSNLPDYPLTKVSEMEYIEGYWYDSDYPEKLYPFPKETDIMVDYEFLEKLDKVMQHMWVDRFKLGGSNCVVRDYMGYSKCRLCGINNGSEEYETKYKNIIYKFPGGIKHYYEKHNVHPSKEFMEFIMNYLLN